MVCLGIFFGVPSPAEPTRQTGLRQTPLSNATALQRMRNALTPGKYSPQASLRRHENISMGMCLCFLEPGQLARAANVQNCPPHFGLKCHWGAWPFCGGAWPPRLTLVIWPRPSVLGGGVYPCLTISGEKRWYLIPKKHCKMKTVFLPFFKIQPFGKVGRGAQNGSFYDQRGKKKWSVWASIY